MKRLLQVPCILLFLGIVSINAGCKKTDKESIIVDTHKTLYVKFVNDYRSVVKITSISIMNMGDVITGKTGKGVAEDGWSENLLSNGTKIVPGGYVFFTLNIPSGEYAEYRLGIETSDGTRILLHEQPNYQGSNPPITHWGGDDRTVSATIWQQETSLQYYIAGWSDFVGITK